MPYTTPPAPADVLAIVPELRDLAKVTVRLHPRPGEVPDPAASKIGGLFLWPEEEPWPSVPNPGKPDWYDDVEWDVDDLEIPLVPVLQLRKDEFSEIPFPDGKDLLQLFWLPTDCSSPVFRAKPYLFWRDSQAVLHPRLETAPLPNWDDWGADQFPVAPHQIFPERIVEYPPLSELRDSKWHDNDPFATEVLRKIGDWPDEQIPQIFDRAVARQFQIPLGESFYASQLSVSLGTKVGGYIRWGQDPHYPRCVHDHRMDHLLTLSDFEWGGDEEARWQPIESEGERQRSPFGICGGTHLIFICHECADRPIQTFYQ